ncbi:MAG: SPFH domain-containing protein [Planctomycetota bacterium]|jgi:regulator of protease activity HflC (stomatin/prohibitin superfamily)
MMDFRRGKNVALIGAALQAAFAIVMLTVTMQSASVSAQACVWLLTGGVGLWLMTAVLFYCYQLQQREAAELDDLASQKGAAGTIFEAERLDAHRVAEARVALMHRWVVPIFTLAWAGYNAAFGYMLMRWAMGGRPPTVIHAEQASLFVVLAGFVAFLFSAYTVGMSRHDAWRPLRAPAAFMLVCVLAMAGVLASLVAATMGHAIVGRIVMHVIPAMQLALAAELVISFVLDLYRPRVAGAAERLAYDSRLCGMLAEPQRIGRSIAETLNYQFGFEVSTTWFYQLLSRAAVPLLMLGVVVVMLMSSIVLVDQGEVAVVSHLGRVDPADPPLAAGAHLKWPWPIDTVRHFDTRIRRAWIGSSESHEGVEHAHEIEAGTFAGRKLALWTAEHGEHELEKLFLVAVSREEMTSDAPAVHVIHLAGWLQYRIADPYKFGYRYADAEKVLADAAHREMIRFCSSATLYDTDSDAESAARPTAIMTHGRGRMTAELQKRIEHAVGPDGVDLGVEIVGLNFQAVHPPAEVAEAYEEALTARLGQDFQRLQARRDAERQYAKIASDPEGAGVAQRLAVARQRAADLKHLQTLHRVGGDVVKQIDAISERVTSHLNELDDDIRRETLAGALRGGRKTVAVNVRGVLREYEGQLVRLRELAAAGKPLDVDDLIAEAEGEAEALFENCTGTFAKMVADAESHRWTKVLAEQGRSQLFPAQADAFEAGPRVFMLDRYLDVWDSVLPTLPKYVIGVDPQRVELRLNLEQGTSFEERVDFRVGGPGESDEE